MTIIAISNQKGGVGKTTTTFHLARAAARSGARVLVVDMDPQANLSAALAADGIVDGQAGVADALSARSPLTLANVLVPTVWEGVTLAPSGGDALAAVRDELIGVQAGREQRLRRAIASVGQVFDLVLVDCPPSLDQLSINALSAADAVLIVTQAKLWSSSGLAHLLETISQVGEYYNSGLKVAGVLVNLHEGQTVSARHWLDELEAACAARGLPLLLPAIPRRVVIADAAEAALGLDQWTPPQMDLQDLYESHLEALLANAGTHGKAGKSGNAGTEGEAK
ncbi:MAG: ParA family protein [Schaalia hyovaginalis]|uniref:Chromosome partitioning protein n=1 Tax=Schaalia hyovaginalis TaxID=29316 RepID=A0A923IXJ2_9ACTO|nr:ParA family protein [Schaalia hyovaginalis]MBB6335122.1 chromosome partitioning protein [Schaalia hyovaginalis]MDY6214060.1 ParA family protein [Schaalia hyovaginalis]